MDESAELAQRALVRRMQHRSGGEEQQAFEEGVIQRVVEHRGQGERGKRSHVIRAKQDGKTRAHEDEANVLDG